MYEDLDINTTDNATIPFREFVDAYYDCRRTKRRKQLARVQVKLHPNKVYIQHYSKGCSFIGGIVRKERIYTCRRTVDNFMMAVKRLNEVEDKESEAEHAVQQLNSYLGFLNTAAHTSTAASV